VRVLSRFESFGIADFGDGFGKGSNNGVKVLYHE